MLYTSPTPATMWPMAERGILLPGLQERRKARLLNQKQMADAAGVARGTVMRAEAGKRVDMPIVAKLADALGVEPAALMQPPE